MLFQVCSVVYLLVQLSGASPTPNKYTALAKCFTKISRPSSATSNQILNYLIQWQYTFVSLSDPKPKNQITIQSTRKVVPNSLHCPFTWETDDDVNRQPKTLLKAKLGPCPSSNQACATNCHAVTYGHQVLKHKCSRVWTWETVNLPVAFVRVWAGARKPPSTETRGFSLWRP